MTDLRDPEGGLRAAQTRGHGPSERATLAGSGAEAEVSKAKAAVEAAIAEAKGAAYATQGCRPSAARPRRAGSAAARSPEPLSRRGASRSVSPLEIGEILLSGLGARTINTVVGSGTLITSPTLLASGSHRSPPMSPTPSGSCPVGLGIPRLPAGALRSARPDPAARGRVAGRRRGRRRPPAGVPEARLGIVPVLIVLGCVLMVFQPRISAWVAERHEGTGGLRSTGLVGWPGVLLGRGVRRLFGAAQGVLLMAIIGIGVDETLQRLNGVRTSRHHRQHRGRARVHRGPDVDWRSPG